MYKRKKQIQKAAHRDIVRLRERIWPIGVIIGVMYPEKPPKWGKWRYLGAYICIRHYVREK